MLEEQTQNKVTRTYSIDRVIEAWVMQRAMRLTGETGVRVSDSKLVNDILTKAMEEDIRDEARKAELLSTVRKIKAIKS